MGTLIPPPRPRTGAPRVELLNFSKRFGSFQALQDVSLTVRAGTFHALLGENGAGKSTLVKALIGFHRADTGSTSIDAREQRIDNPRDAARLGIGMIFQHFTVAPGMTVAENLTLADRELGTFVDWKRERARLAAFMTTAPFPLPLDRVVAGLSAGEKQKLEILKQLYTKRRFLILDEPTSVLTPQEADEVLGRLRAMAQAGELSVLMITHKFREVFGVCDDVTVLRRGRMTGQGRVDAVDRDQLAAWMMGGDLAAATTAEAGIEAGIAPSASAPAVASAPRLSVTGLRVEGQTPGLPAIHDLDLDVRPGEIVGIAGVSGNGQQELLRAISGEEPVPDKRWIHVCGVAAGRMNASRRRGLGMCFVPEERLGRGAVPRLSLTENTLLTAYRKGMLIGGMIRYGAARRFAQECIKRFDVRCGGPNSEAKSLSGGNLQKFIVGREIDADPKLLIVSQPTWGVDVGAAAQIRGELLALRDNGCAVLVVSEELDELFEICDRLVVISQGRISPSVKTAEASIERIGEWMSGLWQDATERPHAAA
jgi:simple sugar transport system ATP-binding protein